MTDTYRAERRRFAKIAKFGCYGLSAMLSVSVLTSLDAGLWAYVWVVLALSFASMAGQAGERV